MQQKADAIYTVGAGERITLEIEATGVGNFATFVVDGRMIPSVPGSSPQRYEPFTVTVGPGLTHFGRVDAHFPSGSPNTARYQIFLTGDQGGGRFTGPDILITDASHASGLQFRR